MKTLIYISIILLLISCNQAHKKYHKSNLKVAVNTKYRKYLDYPVTKIYGTDSIYYDSIQNQTVYLFDSLENGKIEVSVFSLLADDFAREINLQKDTTIFFDTAQYSNFKSISFNEFMSLANNDTDTIFIGQKIVGCFGGSIEKILIAKSAANYKINYTGSNIKFESKNIVLSDSLFNRHYAAFLKESKKLFPQKADGLTFSHISTTHIDTYMRKGNYILEFPDLFDWDGYENFKRGIGISIAQ